MDLQISPKIPTKNQSRKPAAVFKSCPKCASPNLLKCDGEVLCTYCDWNSVEVSVQCASGWFSQPHSAPYRNHKSN